MRTLIAFLSALVLASAARAATLTVIPDKTFYLPGETITLTVIGDDEGALAEGVYGRLVYNSEGTSTVSASQYPVGPAPWLTGMLAHGDGFADAFNQLDGGFGTTPASNLPGVIGVVTLIADGGPGIVNVSWDSLSFFGLTSAPGTSFCLGCEVPEPATGGLLGLGLLALAVSRRRT